MPTAHAYLSTGRRRIKVDDVGKRDLPASWISAGRKAYLASFLWIHSVAWLDNPLITLVTSSLHMVLFFG